MSTDLGAAVAAPEPRTPITSAPERTAEAGEPPATGWDGYRPYLDGLRAVAVYLVVLFHAGSDRFSGGYIGVDIFFVLSGYLVTRLLLRDVMTGGRVHFGRFYSRRFRRLLPAAFVTLSVTALVFSAIASPVEVFDSIGAFKAAFLYVTNWYFIHQAAGYFGADVSSNPVLHFWSLAVEEQFYLLWPLLLAGLFVLVRRFGSRQWLLLRLLVGAGAVASLAWAWSLRVTNPDRAYYGTDARAYQLLAGALLALSPTVIAVLSRRRRAAAWGGILALAGLVIVGTTWPGIDAIQRGTIVTVLAVAVIASLEANRASAAARGLSVEPLVYLGKISYGTYLWHWPVIVVITRSFHPTTASTVAMTVLIATALASLSYQVLERPIRLSTLLDRHRRTVIAVALAASVTAALVLVPTITTRGTNTAGVAAADFTTGFSPVPKGIDWHAVQTDYPVIADCYGKSPAACTIVHGTGAHILVIGDSHAGMIVPTFTALAQQEHLTLSVTTVGDCPWQRNLYTAPLQVGRKPLTVEDCARIKEDLYTRIIPALNPDIVVTMNLGYEGKAQYLQYLGPDRGLIDKNTPQFDAWLGQATTNAVSQLRIGGRKVVLVEPIPFDLAFDSTLCLSGASVIEQCRNVVDDKPSSVEKLYRRLDSEDDHVWSLDLDKLVCPYLPICDPIVNGQIVRSDATHLTSAFARSLAPAVDTFLKQNGILSAGAH